MYYGLCSFLFIVSVSLLSCSEVVPCPPHSSAIVDSVSGDYCVCDQGFLWLGEGCVALNHCPPNSTAEFTLEAIMGVEGSPNTTEDFILTAGDCVCLDGFVSIKGGCFIVYDCPLNSVKPWAVSVADCVCANGYNRVNNTCVHEPSKSSSSDAGFIPGVVGAGFFLFGVWAVAQRMPTSGSYPLKLTQRMDTLVDWGSDVRLAILETTRKNH